MTDLDIPREALALTPPTPPPESLANQFAGHQLYLTGDVSLRIGAFTGVTNVLIAAQCVVYVEGELKPFREELRPTSDRLASTRVVRLPRGHLVHCNVFVSSGSPRYGECYVGVSLVRGDAENNATVLGTLIQGYITASESLAWPGSPLQPSVAGPGATRLIAGADPAAGVDISETVPTNTRWQLLSFAATLVTNAVAVTRLPVLEVLSGATLLFRMVAAEDQIAGETQRYYWAPLGFANTANQGAFAVQGWPPELVLRAGYTLRTFTSGLQAGDNWGEPSFHVREHLEIAP